MKIITGTVLLLFLITTTACSNKTITFRLHNNSSKGFYLIDKETLEETGVSIAGQVNGNKAIFADRKSIYKKISKDNYLDAFATGDNYVFYVLGENDAEVPFENIKAGHRYDSIIIPVQDDITEVDLYIKDTLTNKILLSSKVKTVTTVL